MASSRRLCQTKGPMDSKNNGKKYQKIEKLKLFIELTQCSSVNFFLKNTIRKDSNRDIQKVNTQSHVNLQKCCKNMPKERKKERGMEMSNGQETV